MVCWVGSEFLLAAERERRTRTEYSQANTHEKLIPPIQAWVSCTIFHIDRHLDTVIR